MPAPTATLNDVLSGSQSAGLNPVETGHAVKAWYGDMRGAIEDEIGDKDPEAFFHATEALDRDTFGALSQVQQSANGDGNHPVFAPPRRTDWQPLEHEGAQLGAFRLIERPDSSFDAVVNLHRPDAKTVTGRVVVPTATDEDVQAEIAKADAEIATQKQIAAERKQYLDTPWGTPTEDTVSADASARQMLKEAQAQQFHAEQRKASLQQHGRAILQSEKVSEALKQSPLGKQVGESGVGALAEDFTRGYLTTLASLPVAYYDATGQPTKRDAARETVGLLRDEYAGSTGSRFRGGATGEASKLTEMAGGMAPALAAQALGPAAGTIAGMAWFGATSGSEAIAQALDIADGYDEAAKSAPDAETASRYRQAAADIRDGRGAYALGSGAVMALAGAVPGLKGGGLLKSIARGGLEMAGITTAQQILHQRATGEGGNLKDILESALIGAGMAGAHQALHSGAKAWKGRGESSVVTETATTESPPQTEPVAPQTDAISSELFNNTGREGASDSEFSALDGHAKTAIGVEESTPAVAAPEPPASAEPPAPAPSIPETPPQITFRTFDENGKLKATKEAPHEEAMRELRGRESMLQKILDCLTKKAA